MRNLGIAVLALIALFVGGCGAIFTIIGPISFGGGMLIISMPSLIVGILFARWAIRLSDRPYHRPKGVKPVTFLVGDRIKVFEGKEIIKETDGVSVDGKLYSGSLAAERAIRASQSE